MPVRRSWAKARAVPSGNQQGCPSISALTTRRGVARVAHNSRIPTPTDKGPMSEFFDRLRAAAKSPARQTSNLGGFLFGDRLGEACEAKIFKPQEWQRKLTNRRAEIIVAGTLGSVRSLGGVDIVRDAINRLQQNLTASARQKGQLEIRVTAFLDDCCHRTRWSDRPVDVGAHMTAWHCTPGRTLIAQALGESAGEQGIDLIILIGEFNESARSLEAALCHAKTLRDQGTRIYAFPFGDPRGRAAYREIAQSTGGFSHDLTHPQALPELVPILINSLFGDPSLALPQSCNYPREVAALTQRLLR
jgi:hypothetical protein